MTRIFPIWMLGFSGCMACMAPDTEIMVKGGFFRKVHDVHTMDIVRALDALPGRNLGVTTDVVRAQASTTVGTLFEIKLRIIGEEADSNTLYLTGQHYFCPTKKGERWMRVSGCKIGDRIHAWGGKEAEIVSFQKIDYSRKDAVLPWTKDFGTDRRQTYNIGLTKEVAWFVRREGKTPVAVANEADLFGYYEGLKEQAEPPDDEEDPD